MSESTKKKSQRSKMPKKQAKTATVALLDAKKGKLVRANIDEELYHLFERVGHQVGSCRELLGEMIKSSRRSLPNRPFRILDLSNFHK